MKLLVSLVTASLLLTGCSKSLSLDDQTKLLEYDDLICGDTGQVAVIIFDLIEQFAQSAEEMVDEGGDH